MPKAGEQIGPYTLVSQLGRGAFGVVWLAERRGAFATTKVAIKLALEDEPDLEAIRQESELWANLGGHPNVLPIIEAERYDEHVVIVSEYAPDGSLDSWLKKHGGRASSIESAISMTTGILNGLEHLHNKKIIHRDLKPANILLQGEMPRLADFGLARVLRSSARSTGIAGTPSYMAPEVFSGERYVESDLWSVGVILYQMLSGRLPFPQTDIMALVGALASREPEPLPAYVPTQVADVILQALQKNIPNRFRSASEMRIALQNITSVGTIVPLATIKQEDDKPTEIIDVVRKTGDEQASTKISENVATVKVQQASSNEQVAVKTAEQITDLATRQHTIAVLPPTEKILNLDKKQEELEARSDKTLAKLAYKRVALGVVVSIMVFGVWRMWAMGLPPFESRVTLYVPDGVPVSASGAGLEDKRTTIVNNSPDESVLQEQLAKETEQLLQDIDQKNQLVEEKLDTLPDSKEKEKLTNAFATIRDNFQSKASEENQLDKLKSIYEKHITELEKLAKELDKQKLAKPTPPDPEMAIPPIDPSNFTPKPPIPKRFNGSMFHGKVEFKDGEITPEQVMILKKLAKEIGMDYDIKNQDPQYWIKFARKLKAYEEQKRAKEQVKKNSNKTDNTEVDNNN